MGIETNIEFCDSTVNLATGCDGCELWNPKAGIKKCYAGNLVNFHGGPGKKGWPISFDQPMLFPQRLAQILKMSDLTGTIRAGKHWLNAYPRVIFLNDLSDTFTKSLPEDWLAEHLSALANSRHVILLITKNARRMRDFFSRHKVPKNFWLLVTVTSKATYGRVRDLAAIDHDGVKGISYEPALGPIRLGDIPGIEAINWTIAGGESGFPKEVTPFDISWMRAVGDDAGERGIRFFAKQLGSAPMQRLAREGENPYAPDQEWPSGTHFGNRTGKPEFNGRMALLKDSKFAGDPNEWPTDLHVREMPMPEIYAKQRQIQPQAFLFA